MARHDRSHLVEDSTGRKKLKIFLPGGRYQLSLRDGGVTLLCDHLGHEIRDVVSNCVVRVLVATGDAWFPHQRDYESILEDLPNDGSLDDSAAVAIAEYLQTARVPAARLQTVTRIIRELGLSEFVDPDDVAVTELPSLPEGIFDDRVDSPTRDEPTQDDTGVSRTSTDNRPDELLKDQGGWEDSDVLDIPGIGPKRAKVLSAAGFDSTDELTQTRPADLAEVPSFDEKAATVIVEGARELLGQKSSTAEELARQTGEDESVFEAALSQLAAAGVPPSAAMPTLLRVYGPSISDIDSVDGRMAYFLFEAGYTTPWEVAQATLEELETVDYLGPSTASQVKQDAEATLGF